MKRKLLNALLTLLPLCWAGAANAQTYQPLTVSSGYNEDVFANGVGTAMSSTSSGVDNANFAFVANNYQTTSAATPPAYGIPSTGIISSAATTGLNYQLGSLSTNNSLKIATANTPGTLTFSNPLAATKLYVLTTSGSGESTGTFVITFTDNTTQTISSTTVPDWFDSTLLPVAASGFGRINRANNVIENPFGNPRMYQLTLNILPANYTRQVASLQVTKTSTAEGVINIFAVTADAISECPSPSSGFGYTSTANSATINWGPAILVPAVGYEYYHSATSTAPTATTTPSGSTTAAVTTATISGLPTGQTEHWWVRSVCSETSKGFWVYGGTYTTGQITATYTTGDISTDFIEAGDLTLNSATGCPATLSVTVPAGYQISGVSTTYSMVSTNNAYTEEQRSIVRCVTNNTQEAAITAGTGSDPGTQNYNRTGLTIANTLTGTVTFQMKAWRVWGESLDTACGVQYTKIPSGSWKVIVTYSPLACTPPAAPTAAAQSFCSSSNPTVAGLTATGATGNTFTWYSAATGGTALATTQALATGTYYVSQSAGACESTRTPVSVTVTTVTQPTVAVTTFCGSATVADLATASTGATLTWTLGGNPVAATAALTTGTYVGTQTIGTCSSTPLSVAVTVGATPQPVVPVTAFCNGATVANLATPATGGTIEWWFNGNVVTPATPLTNGTYTGTQTIGICNSAPLAVAITVSTTPQPTVPTQQTFCIGATVADLQGTPATGATFNWYLDNELQESTDALSSEGVYTLSQTLNGCESYTIDVFVTLNPIPDAPTATAIQDFCDGATALSLQAEGDEGATLHWYHNGEELTGGEYTLTSGMYTVSQSTGNCFSEPATVTVTVYPIPEAPQADDFQTFVAGETVSDLEVELSILYTTNWYILDEDVYVSIPSNTILESGVTYYVSQSSLNCESAFTPITVTDEAGTNAFEFKGFRAYPIPATDILTVINTQDLTQITIYNLLGQEVLNQKANTSTATVNLSGLASGSYILRAWTGNGKSASINIVKQ